MNELTKEWTRKAVRRSKKSIPPPSCGVASGRTKTSILLSKDPVFDVQKKFKNLFDD
jgi:hypothetical protein